MKRYELTYIVTRYNMTRHDINQWIRAMNKQGLEVTFEGMMKQTDEMAGQVLVGIQGTLTAVLSEGEDSIETIKIAH